MCGHTNHLVGDCFFHKKTYAQPPRNGNPSSKHNANIIIENETFRNTFRYHSCNEHGLLYIWLVDKYMSKYTCVCRSLCIYILLGPKWKTCSYGKWCHCSCAWDQMRRTEVIFYEDACPSWYVSYPINSKEFNKWIDFV